MRADEYLVIEIQKLKEENEQLKEENAKLLKMTQTPKEDVSKSTVIEIKDKVQMIYLVSILSSWQYRDFIKKDPENNIKKLKECLTNDKTLEKTVICASYYNNDTPYSIADRACQFETTYKGHKAYTHYYEYEKKLEAYIYSEKDNVFLNYEDALKYAQEKSRDVIGRCIEEYEKEKEKEEKEKVNE